MSGKVVKTSVVSECVLLNVNDSYVYLTADEAVFLASSLMDLASKLNSKTEEGAPNA